MKLSQRVTRTITRSLLLPALLLPVLGGTSASANQTAPAKRLNPEQSISFLNDVEPVLTHAGCNSGPCHGSQFGKGGFKLSLAAYDPELDFETIVRAARGRRVCSSDPSGSPILQKPTMQVPHAGGMRLTRGGDGYRVLLQWIRNGMPGPNSTDPVPVAIKPSPERARLRLGGTNQIRVLATFSNGSIRDVTGQTRITSVTETVARVAADGVVSAIGYGDGAIMLRYQGLAAAAHITIPYPATTIPTMPAAKTYIDRMIQARWKELNLSPSPDCSDERFIRRASLDIAGTLPTTEEIAAFAADKHLERDSRLIDRLLSSPSYADYWALKWGDLLRNSRTTTSEKEVWSLRNWLYDAFRQNMGYDTFVSLLLTGSGSSSSYGPANYYRLARTPQDLAEETSQVFLGIRLQCAKCHHHPFEKWSQSDYYRFAACFARVGEKSGKDYGTGSAEHVVVSLHEGEVRHPKTGLVLTAAPLENDRTNITFGIDGADRRSELAAWMTGKQNIEFSKSIVNRYWSYFLGRGIVNPVDDMRVTNPASCPELLEGLARNFIHGGYDLKGLIKQICTSRLYRLSATPTPQNRLDMVFYTHFQPRRMPAEVLADAIDFVTSSAEKYSGLPVGSRAIQLPDPNVVSGFLEAFGRPPRTSASECERTGDPGLAQSLQMLNGELIYRKLSDTSPLSTVSRLATPGIAPEAVVTTLFKLALTRLPRPRELAAGVGAITKAETRRKGVEDLLWALLNSSEFITVQ